MSDLNESFCREIEFYDSFCFWLCDPFFCEDNFQHESTKRATAANLVCHFHQSGKNCHLDIFDAEVDIIFFSLFFFAIDHTFRLRTELLQGYILQTAVKTIPQHKSFRKKTPVAKNNSLRYQKLPSRSKNYNFKETYFFGGGWSHCLQGCSFEDSMRTHWHSWDAKKF